MIPEYVHVGDFCPNEDCPDQGKLQVGQRKENIKKRVRQMLKKTASWRSHFVNMKISHSSQPKARAAGADVFFLKGCRAEELQAAIVDTV